MRVAINSESKRWIWFIWTGSWICLSDSLGSIYFWDLIKFRNLNHWFVNKFLKLRFTKILTCMHKLCKIYSLKIQSCFTNMIKYNFSCNSLTASIFFNHVDKLFIINDTVSIINCCHHFIHQIIHLWKRKDNFKVIAFLIYM